jgi:uncharacterized membrane protein
MAPPDYDRQAFNRSRCATILIGIGLMAAVDEIVFHQLLAWHHFFDRSTLAIGLLSDGLLHSAELLMLVAGFFMLARLRDDQQFRSDAGWAGLFIGAGGFQLFDGIVNHKILGLHQVRYVENLLLYDVLWNVAGLALVWVGLWLSRRTRRPSAK